MRNLSETRFKELQKGLEFQNRQITSSTERKLETDISASKEVRSLEGNKIIGDNSKQSLKGVENQKESCLLVMFLIMNA